MNNSDMLEHLLKIEAEAAALVADAQAEADKRIEEAEKQNHSAYTSAYQNEAALLEEQYQKEIEEIHSYSQKELELYRKKIENIQVDTNRFSSILVSFFTGGL